MILKGGAIVMEIVEKLDKNEHWKQVYRLIRTQLQDVMPSHYITDQEIATIITMPTHYNDSKFGAKTGYHQLYFALVRDEVIAATQLFFPIEEQAADIYWLVGKKGYQSELIQFVAHLKQVVFAHGKKEVGSARNPFGLGWSGCSSNWTQLIRALLANNFKFDNQWLNYLLSTELIHNSIDQPLDARQIWDKKERRVEFHFFLNETEVGEVDIWFPTSHSASLATMATIEYMEIYKAYRRQGLAQAGIQAIKKQLPHITNFMLWTEQDNIAMRKTAEKSGFQQKESMYWYRG